MISHGLALSRGKQPIHEVFSVVNQQFEKFDGADLV